MSNNKTIAKNTVFLYFRMLFTVGIGLYASRLVLQNLGVVDYGIYNVVGGVVAIFTFLHSTLSGATTRFLNVNMINGIAVLKKVFNTAMFLHIGLALLILIFCETIGLWFFFNKLNIPEERINIAFWVYQMSIVTSIFSVIQIPYDAAIIAHEKMSVYAYLSILEAFLKLLIIALLPFMRYDKLLMYALLILIVYILLRYIYQIYCRREFDECKLSLSFDRSIFKTMLHFFGWDFYGNMCFAFNNFGTNILQNMFFGPIINASISIVSQAQGGILLLGNNLSFAIKPQMIQAYSRTDFDRMNELLLKGTKYSFLIVSFVTIPFFVFSDFIIEVWLGEIPFLSDNLLRIAIITLMINLSFNLLIPIIHATGKIRLISFVGGSVYLLSLLMSYFFLNYGYDPTIPYIVNSFAVFFAGLINVFILQKYVRTFNSYYFIIKLIGKLFVFFVINLILCIIISSFIEKNLYSFFLIAICSSIMIIFFNINFLEIKTLILTIKNRLNIKI